MIASDTEAKELFWTSVREHAMKLPYCLSCRAFFYYPRQVCPACWSPEIEYRPVRGTGVVWTYSVVRSAHGNPTVWHDRIPYAVALVDLDEGVRIMANVVDCSVDAVRSGLAVQLTYIDVEGTTLPAFTLAAMETTAMPKARTIANDIALH